MNDELLKTMLKAADESAAPLGVVEGLSARVKERVRRRATIRRRAASVAMVVVVLVGAIIIDRFVPGRRQELHRPLASGDPRGLAAGEPIPRPRPDMEQLAAETALHERTVAALLEAEAADRRRKAVAQLLAQPDPLDALEEAGNRAAQIMLDRGERLAQEPGRRLEAADAYRRVLELFPDSRAATDARRRITEIRG